MEKPRGIGPTDFDQMKKEGGTRYCRQSWQSQKSLRDPLKGGGKREREGGPAQLQKREIAQVIHVGEESGLLSWRPTVRKKNC